MDQARVVVIGGGITGCSVAYHLASTGWTDVVLLEKGALTSGATCQAMGLVTAFNPAATMAEYRRYSIELYRALGVFETSGSLRLASSPDQMHELRRTLSRTRTYGIEADLLSATETLARLPGADAARLEGSAWLPGDGYLDPHGATHALAAAARELGVRIRTNSRVESVELGRDGAVARVHTATGPIACEHVVDAAGLWAPQVAAMVGAWLPSVPVDHQHAALLAVPGRELPRGLPCVRDPELLVYGRAEAGGMLIGGYEADPPARWIDGVPWDHGSASLPPDEGRFLPLVDSASRRFPFLADAQIGRIVCHPDAMTPDANPLLGPWPGVPGFWVAAGLSLNGFGGAGGIGRTIAAWMTAGEPDLDVTAYRAWRFADPYRDPGYAAATAREAYTFYYRQRYPHDTDQAGRPRRLSALHGRLQDGGAVFGTKHGWERPDLFQPGRPWRRAGYDGRVWGFGRPDWFERVGEEHTAVRERVGLLDLSSFGKIAASGPGARLLLDRVAANRIGPTGSVTYSQFLDGRGGIVADLTIAALAPDRYRVVTGAASAASDLGWLRAHLQPDDQSVQLVDESDLWACIALWGPLARDVLATVTGTDVSDAALPYRSIRPVAIGPARVEAARLSYAGELGWELYTARETASQVWDALARAGRDRGIAPVGYRALESLRLEKGYRYLGTDLTAADGPDEAGLGSFVRLDKGDFIGREAVAAARAAGPPARRLRTVLIGPDATWLPVYGGEAVAIDGRTVGRLRSAGFGHTVQRTLGTVYLPANTSEEGRELSVEILGDLVAAVVAPDALHDPTGRRMRG
jgi:glycine cleavage system aminomethyltransferase T/glycine/D-amino acid oxidase-like deaminating enzyme